MGLLRQVGADLGISIPVAFPTVAPMQMRVLQQAGAAGARMAETPRPPAAATTARRLMSSREPAMSPPRDHARGDPRRRIPRPWRQAAALWPLARHGGYPSTSLTRISARCPWRRSTSTILWA